MDEVIALKRRLQTSIYNRRNEEISEIIEAVPSLIWTYRFKRYAHYHDGTEMSIATYAAENGQLDLLKQMNRLIRDNSSPRLLTGRLMKTFEDKSGKPNKDPVRDEGEREDTPVSRAAESLAESSVECLRYLVEECCPSGVLTLQEKDYSGITCLFSALTSGNLECVDYILTHAPRGLAMMDDVSDDGDSGWSIGLSEDFEYNPMLKEYVINAREIFLGRENERVIEAMEHLREEGFGLPSILLDVISQQNNVLQYRERTMRSTN